jgi:group I intron endonuclease
MSGIYKIKNLINEKVYIGSAISLKNRWKTHISCLNKNKHHSSKLQNSWNKHSSIGFIFEIIEECEKEKLIEREQFFIDLYNSYKEGYNCTPKAGSNLGRKCSDETIKRMSAILIGNKRSLGCRHSDKTLKKLSDLNKGCKNKMFNKKHSDQTKIKISNALKGKRNSLGVKRSIETKTKISDSLIKKIGREARKYNPTPILQYDLKNNFIKEWKDIVSLKEANFKSNKIYCVCRGIRKTSQKYIWKFKHD